ncbi:unnamed protein product [Linum tenue]|uniref:Auxin response factor n=1 Tax=Linum tenue TaxID=586396 RepID=A0AAV0RJR4_9ROSI|nr:unnamed protein product [Linum tenue]
MVGLIDLNMTEEEEPTPSSRSLLSSSSSSSASTLSASNAAASPPVSVCLELWHACAGPLISLPKKGSVVVYLPQGHVEQLADSSPPAGAAYDRLPPHVFCRVVDVKLHAETATDEVYAQVSLVPENEVGCYQSEVKLRGIEGEEDGELVGKASTTPHMFCKTLTASDTSTHGGFSVPRRAAEDCFPPLDYTQQRPSQELVAKDLHGFEWRFRHIYRGQPRRHLLTTGWSAFVNRKKLVSGDAVLFLRGEDGELRLGVRRAAQVKPSSAAMPVLCSQLPNHSSLSDVANAVALRTVFNVCYNPRVSSSEFVIPLNKFMKSLDYSFCAGMRFKMRFETEDAAERRYSGMITGISDLDPARWPGSKWRCLMVRWDDMEVNRHSRVSPWEIEASGSISSSCHSFLGPVLKRTRSALPSSMPEFPVPDGIGAPDFGESSSRFHKVLQGQEISSFNTRFDADQMRCFRGPPPDMSYKKGIGFGESLGFHRVLQGQEIFPSSRTGWSAATMRPAAAQQQAPSSSPPSVLMFQQGSNSALQNPGGGRNSNSQPHWFSNNGTAGANGIMQMGIHPVEQPSLHEPVIPFMSVGQNVVPSSCKSSCRLFGFSLTDERRGGGVNMEDKSSNHQIASLPVANLLPEASARKQFHPTPPVIANAVGRNCTNGTLPQYYPENYHIY